MIKKLKLNPRCLEFLKKTISDLYLDQVIMVVEDKATKTIKDNDGNFCFHVDFPVTKTQSALDIKVEFTKSDFHEVFSLELYKKYDGTKWMYSKPSGCWAVIYNKKHEIKYVASFSKEVVILHDEDAFMLIPSLND